MTVFIQSGSICLVAIVMATSVVADDVAETKTVAESSTELSVPPLDQIEYPADRPSWLGDGPDLDSRIHSWVVVTSPGDTVEQCAYELEVLTRAAVLTYMKQLTKADEVDFYPVNDEWIESRLIVQRYTGSLTQADNEMFEQAVKLEFTPSTQKEIKEALKKVQVRDRLGALGVLVFFGLVGLICCSTVLGMVSRRVGRQSAAM